MTLSNIIKTLHYMILNHALSHNAPWTQQSWSYRFCTFIFCEINQKVWSPKWKSLQFQYPLLSRKYVITLNFKSWTRPWLQLCQAPGLDKEKEWTSKRIQTCWTKIFRQYWTSDLWIWTSEIWIIVYWIWTLAQQYLSQFFIN